MGKLLDQVLQIHQLRRCRDVSDSAINKHIESINAKILSIADKGGTAVSINFEGLYNDSISTTKAISYDNSIYDYYVNETKSISFIKQKLSNYYKDEGFDIADSNCTLRINWFNKVMGINE